MNIPKLDTSNFKQTIESSSKPIIVDFYADWCGPCKMVAPILEEIASENESEMTIYKVNIDENPELAREFSVMSIPSIISFKNGKIYKRAVGVQLKQSLIQLIN